MPSHLEENRMLLFMFVTLSLTLSSVSSTIIYRQSLAAFPLAVCNDGQAAALYYEGPSQVAKEYLIGFQGGGECHTIEGCYQRCENTSSPDYRFCGPFTRPRHNLEGMYSSNATINPTFHNYHKTFIPYCSSDFHSGNKTASSETGGYHFRGKEIFVAAIAYMKLHTDVANADTVVLNGGSAGGFGVLANCDFLRTLLPGVDVRCVADAAGFVPLNLAKGCPWDIDGIFFDYIPTFWNGIPNELCSQSTNPQTQKNCYDLEYVLKFIRSPLFIITNVFDTIYMPRVCQYRLDNHAQAYFRQWGSYMEKNAITFPVKYPTWGLFMPSCNAHGLYKIDRWFTQLLVGEDQISMAQALDNWMKQSGPYVIRDECPDQSVPCNVHCP